jgi:hypothetical protein
LEATFGRTKPSACVSWRWHALTQHNDIDQSSFLPSALWRCLCPCPCPWGFYPIAPGQKKEKKKKKKEKRKGTHNFF